MSASYTSEKCLIYRIYIYSFPLERMNEAMETNVAQAGIKIAYIAK